MTSDATTDAFAKPLRLTLVTLGVEDVARATRFYEALGAKRSQESNETVSFFDLGGVVLSLYGREEIAKDAGLSPEGSGFRPSTLAWNLGSREEVDKAVVRMVAAGGALLKAGEATFWGGYAAYVADPDGHVWEIAHNPFWPLDPDGGMRLPR